MQMHTALTHPIRAGLLYGALTLFCLDSAVAPEMHRAQQRPLQQARFAVLDTGVLIERVDFVLDQAPPVKDEEAQKKRKTEQRRAAAAKPKPNVKAVSELAAPSERPGATANNPPHEAASPAAATPAEQGARAAMPQPTPASLAVAASRPAVTLAPAPTSAPALPATLGIAPAAAPQQSQQSPKPQVDVKASPSATLNTVNNPQPADATRPPRLSREQLLALLPGSTILRTNKSGALRQWVNSPDGTLTVYWSGGGGRLRSKSASGKWSVTDEGRFCLRIDWDDNPENWCRFLVRTATGEYQPIADLADANWTPPTDASNWRPMTIRH